MSQATTNKAKVAVKMSNETAIFHQDAFGERSFISKKPQE